MGAYKRLIKAVEDVDFAALQRERGKEVEQIGNLFDSVEKEFDELLKVVGQDGR